ncbi:MAG: response regulator transcription factor [Luteolibacter sp.]
MTQVWILEDHQVFAKHVRRLLAGEADIDCPHHFSHPDELFEKLRFTTERPDVLLLDLGLPGRDGLQVLDEVRQVLPELKVLILSAFDDRERVYRAICNGASGYLLKTADPDEILSWHPRCDPRGFRAQRPDRQHDPPGLRPLRSGPEDRTTHHS